MAPLTPPTSQRTLAVFLLIILTASGFVGPQVTGGDGSPTGDPTPPTQSEREAHPLWNATYGIYLLDGEKHTLTSKHAHRFEDGLRLQVPREASHLVLQRERLSEILGEAWSATEPFYYNQTTGNVTIIGAAATLYRGPSSGSERFTLGTFEGVAFSDRPMKLSVHRDAGGVALDMDDGSTQGQEVFVSHEFLNDFGIHKPRAQHEDGNLIEVWLDDKLGGYWIRVPHFSIVFLSADDILVYGRKAGVVSPHSGSITWNEADQKLRIEVENELVSYDVLVEAKWLDLHLPNLALKGIPWTKEFYKGEEYYVVSFAAFETPTVVEFLEFRLTETRLYTYGSPHFVQSHPYNTTLREEKGPIWVSTLIEGPWVRVDVDTDNTDEFELLLSAAWIEEDGAEPLHFTDATNHISTELLIDGSWLVTFANSTTLEIFDSSLGPLAPTRYEETLSGVLAHRSHCRLIYTVEVNNGELIGEGPGCIEAGQLDILSQSVSQHQWIGPADPWATCAIFLDTTRNYSAFAGVSCSYAVAPGETPPFLESWCGERKWSLKAEAAFCGPGLTRYESAGLALGEQNASKLSEILLSPDKYFHLYETVVHNLTLGAERDWWQSFVEFFDESGWPVRCANSTAPILMTEIIPKSICGTSTGDLTAADPSLEADQIAGAWNILATETPCAQKEALFLLDNVTQFACGDAIPLISSPIDSLVDEIPWSAECESAKGLALADIGGTTPGLWTCASVLPRPTSTETSEAWASLRSWDACKEEVSFALNPDGALPTTICGQASEPMHQNLSYVFDHVQAQNTCEQTPVLVVDPTSSDWLVVCSQTIDISDQEWQNDWATVDAENPCGGELPLILGNNTLGQICDTSIPTPAAWEGAYDNLSVSTCQNAGERAVFVPSTGNPLFFCGRDFPADNESAIALMLKAYWNPCGGQAAAFHSTLQTAEGRRACNVSITTFDEIVKDLNSWQEANVACPGLPFIAKVSALGAPSACGKTQENGGPSEALSALALGNPCRESIPFVLVFAPIPFAYCGMKMADYEASFESTRAVSESMAPCSTDATSGEAFCGIPIPDHAAYCDTGTNPAGACLTHVFDKENATVRVGYPIIRNDTALWYVGAREVSVESSDCAAGAEVCFSFGNLSGVMAAFTQGNKSIKSWGILNDANSEFLGTATDDLIIRALKVSAGVTEVSMRYNGVEITEESPPDGLRMSRPGTFPRLWEWYMIHDVPTYTPYFSPFTPFILYDPDRPTNFAFSATVEGAFVACNHIWHVIGDGAFEMVAGGWYDVGTYEGIIWYAAHLNKEGLGGTIFQSGYCTDQVPDHSAETGLDLGGFINAYPATICYSTAPECVVGYETFHTRSMGGFYWNSECFAIGDIPCV